MASTEVLIIGGGMFGRAMGSLCDVNTVPVTIIDKGEYADRSYPVVFLVTPVAALRTVLTDNAVAFRDDTVIISCSKGIDQERYLLPHQIYGERGIPGRYYALAGPSFAREVMERVPTVVDIAGMTTDADIGNIQSILTTAYFKIEAHDSVLEIELAGAMKNVYAIAAGFIAGSGGGENTHAHLQVVALREYQMLAESLEGKRDVVRPSIVGDLELTSGSTESRNYRYGKARALGGDLVDVTVEGKHTVRPLLALANSRSVNLPLARAVQSVVDGSAQARAEIYTALGF